MQDLSCAMEYIFTHQNDLKISVNGYSAWGGSAGARMAAYLGSYGTKAFGGKELPRPAAVIMGYTGHSDFTRSEPPTFMFVGSEDWIANPEKMRKTAEKLSQSGIEIEFHIYPNLGHGFGLGTGTSAEGWLDKATSFWQKHLPPSLEIPNINPSQTSDQQ